MENSKYPLISCCCVTRSRPNLLLRSIACFINQTYPNKELVLVYEDNDILTKKIIKSIRNSNISIYKVKKIKKYSLDYLKNYSVEKSKGDYICRWNENDWYHIARLEFQYRAIHLKGFQACVMTQCLFFDDTIKKAYVTNKILLEDSLLCMKHIIRDIKYEDFNKEGDNSLIEYLNNEKKIYTLNDVPNLYVIIYHSNYTGDDTERGLYDRFGLNSLDSNIIKNILDDDENIIEGSLKIDKLLGSHLLQENNSNNYPAKIPKIIHTTCQSKIIPNKFKLFYKRMEILHSDWEINIYDDSDAYKIVEEYFPEILEIYKGYPCNIQRMDIFRILIIYLKGGFYLDIDMYCLKSLNDLRHFSLVLGEERTYSDEEYKMNNLNINLQIANYMFGSIPRHHFWIEVLLEGINRASNEINRENDVLITTGPWLLSEVYNRIGDKYNDIELIKNKFRLCVKHCQSISCRFGDYAVHFHMGTWRWQSENIIKSRPRNSSNKNIERSIKNAQCKISKLLKD